MNALTAILSAVIHLESELGYIANDERDNKRIYPQFHC